MTLVSMKKVVSRSWDEIPMPDTIIAQVNALVHRKSNDIDFVDSKKRPIVDINTTVVDDG